MTATASVRARSNIALVKYWGKRDPVLNTPAVGSVSITLDRLWTDTTVSFDRAYAADTLVLDGETRDAEVGRVSKWLDLVREVAGTDLRARIVSRNNFPTAAGLASSASGFAALTAAATRALSLDLDDRELTILARRGSGSAARSLHGGYVWMHRGRDEDGSDAYAEPLLEADAWPLTVIVAITAGGRKAVSSGRGMTQSAASSAYYAAWVDSHDADMRAARDAIDARDFDSLARVSESSCLKMHAAAITTDPPLIYWRPATLACIAAVRELRAAGSPVFFTIDAGPQVKAVCLPEAAPAVEQRLRAVEGVVDLIVTGLGPGIETLPDSAETAE